MCDFFMDFYNGIQSMPSQPGGMAMLIALAVANILVIIWVRKGTGEVKKTVETSFKATPPPAVSSVNVNIDAERLVDRFAAAVGDAFRYALNNQSDIIPPDPREKLCGVWIDELTDTRYYVTKRGSYYATYAESKGIPEINFEMSLLRYIDCDTYDKELYTAYGKRYRILAYDEAADSLLIAELGLILHRWKEESDPAVETKGDDMEHFCGMKKEYTIRPDLSRRIADAIKDYYNSNPESKK